MLRAVTKGELTHSLGIITLLEFVDSDERCFYETFNHERESIPRYVVSPEDATARLARCDTQLTAN